MQLLRTRRETTTIDHSSFGVRDLTFFARPTLFGNHERRSTGLRRRESIFRYRLPRHDAQDKTATRISARYNTLYSEYLAKVISLALQTDICWKVKVDYYAITWSPLSKQASPTTTAPCYSSSHTGRHQDEDCRPCTACSRQIMHRQLVGLHLRFQIHHHTGPSRRGVPSN